MLLWYWDNWGQHGDDWTRELRGLWVNKPVPIQGLVWFWPWQTSGGAGYTPIYSDHQELEALDTGSISLKPENLVKSRRLQGLPLEYGAWVLPTMTTTTTSHTVETCGTEQVHPSLVFDKPRLPRPFHGDRSEDVEDWLNDFNRAAYVNCWSEKKKAGYVYFTLEDCTRAWFINLEPSITSWQVLYE